MPCLVGWASSPSPCFSAHSLSSTHYSPESTLSPQASGATILESSTRPCLRSSGLTGQPFRWEICWPLEAVIFSECTLFQMRFESSKRSLVDPERFYEVVFSIRMRLAGRF